MAKSVGSNVVLKITGAILRVFLNIIFYIVIVLVVFKASKFTFDFSYQMFGSVAVAAEPGIDKEFVILKGETTLEISKKLEISKLIVDQYSFYLKTKFKEYDIFPGTYILNNSMDYDAILNIITDLKNSIVKEETTVETETVPNSNKIP